MVDAGQLTARERQRRDGRRAEGEEPKWGGGVRTLNEGHGGAGGMGAARAGSSGAGATRTEGGGGSEGGRDAEGGEGERVVRREEGMRVEEWRGRRHGKRRVDDQMVIAPDVSQPSIKMPKRSKVIQWTAVGRDAYMEGEAEAVRAGGGWRV